MGNDELVDILQETISEERSAPGRRASSERRTGRPSNYSGPEQRGGTDRRAITDRRSGGDRRAGAERRHGLRREEDQKSFQKRIEEGELTLEEVEFVRAVDHYKRKFNRPFPTWSEVLAIVKGLGYTKDSLS